MQVLERLCLCANLRQRKDLTVRALRPRFAHCGPARTDIVQDQETALMSTAPVSL
jgi:hypothetical protein